MSLGVACVVRVCKRVSSCVTAVSHPLHALVSAKGARSVLRPLLRLASRRDPSRTLTLARPQAMADSHQQQQQPQEHTELGRRAKLTQDALVVASSKVIKTLECAPHSLAGVTGATDGAYACAATRP